MRKIGFIALFLPLLFLGCDVASYSILLTNSTETKTVSYMFNGTYGTLNPLGTRAHEVGAWMQPPVDVVDQHGIASIKVVTNGMTGDHTFVYARPIILEVINTLPIDVTIQAGNFIYNSFSSTSDDVRTTMFLAIRAHDTATAVIYTENPQFTAPTDICQEVIDRYELFANRGFPIYFDINIDRSYIYDDYDDDNKYPLEPSDPPYEDDNGESPSPRPQIKMFLTIR